MLAPMLRPHPPPSRAPPTSPPTSRPVRTGSPCPWAVVAGGQGLAAVVVGAVGALVAVGVAGAVGRAAVAGAADGSTTGSSWCAPSVAGRPDAAAVRHARGRYARSARLGRRAAVGRNGRHPLVDPAAPGAGRGADNAAPRGLPEPLLVDVPAGRGDRGLSRRAGVRRARHGDTPARCGGQPLSPQTAVPHGSALVSDQSIVIDWPAPMQLAIALIDVT